MRRCPKCNEEVRGNEKFCMNCGEKLPPENNNTSKKITIIIAVVAVIIAAIAIIYLNSGKKDEAVEEKVKADEPIYEEQEEIEKFKQTTLFGEYTIENFLDEFGSDTKWKMRKSNSKDLVEFRTRLKFDSDNRLLLIDFPADKSPIEIHKSILDKEDISKDVITDLFLKDRDTTKLFVDLLRLNAQYNVDLFSKGKDQFIKWAETTTNIKDDLNFMIELIEENEKRSEGPVDISEYFFVDKAGLDFENAVNDFIKSIFGTDEESDIEDVEDGQDDDSSTSQSMETEDKKSEANAKPEEKPSYEFTYEDYYIESDPNDPLIGTWKGQNVTDQYDFIDQYLFIRQKSGNQYVVISMLNALDGHSQLITLHTGSYLVLSPNPDLFTISRSESVKEATGIFNRGNSLKKMELRYDGNILYLSDDKNVKFSKMN